MTLPFLSSKFLCFFFLYLIKRFDSISSLSLLALAGPYILWLVCFSKPEDAKSSRFNCFTGHIRDSSLDTNHWRSLMVISRLGWGLLIVTQDSNMATTSSTCAGSGALVYVALRFDNLCSLFCSMNSRTPLFLISEVPCYFYSVLWYPLDLISTKLLWANVTNIEYPTLMLPWPYTLFGIQMLCSSRNRMLPWIFDSGRSACSFISCLPSTICHSISFGW